MPRSVLRPAYKVSREIYLPNLFNLRLKRKKAALEGPCIATQSIASSLLKWIINYQYAYRSDALQCLLLVLSGCCGG